MAERLNDHFNKIIQHLIWIFGRMCWMLDLCISLFYFFFTFLPSPPFKVIFNVRNLFYIFNFFFFLFLFFIVVIMMVPFFILYSLCSTNVRIFRQLRVWFEVDFVGVGVKNEIKTIREKIHIVETKNSHLFHSINLLMFRAYFIDEKKKTNKSTARIVVICLSQFKEVNPKITLSAPT